MEYAVNFHHLLCTFGLAFLICLVFSLCPEHGSSGHYLSVSEEYRYNSEQRCLLILTEEVHAI